MVCCLFFSQYYRLQDLFKSAGKTGYWVLSLNHYLFKNKGRADFNSSAYSFMPSCLNHILMTERSDSLDMGYHQIKF